MELLLAGFEMIILCNHSTQDTHILLEKLVPSWRSGRLGTFPLTFTNPAVERNRAISGSPRSYNSFYSPWYPLSMWSFAFPIYMLICILYIYQKNEGETPCLAFFPSNPGVLKKCLKHSNRAKGHSIISWTLITGAMWNHQFWSFHRITPHGKLRCPNVDERLDPVSTRFGRIFLNFWQFMEHQCAPNF